MKQTFTFAPGSVIILPDGTKHSFREMTITTKPVTGKDSSWQYAGPSTVRVK